MRNVAEVIRWSREASPREACGITIDGLAYLCPNVSLDPERNFAIEGEYLLEILGATEGRWDGVWHSHPNGADRPSANDIAYQPMGKTLYICTLARVLAFEADGEGPVATYE